MATTDDDSYTEYITSKMQWLRGAAYLLCQDWHRADDLGQTTMTKLYVHWARAVDFGNIDGYVRTILVNTFLAEQRSPWWRRVVPHREELGTPEAAADTAAAGAGGQNVEAVLDLRSALKALPARQRATIVLRYYDELSVKETADALGCSEGTVKSQTARALVTLRAALEAPPREIHFPDSSATVFRSLAQPGGTSS